MVETGREWSRTVEKPVEEDCLGLDFSAFSTNLDQSRPISTSLRSISTGFDWYGSQWVLEKFSRRMPILLFSGLDAFFARPILDQPKNLDHFYHLDRGRSQVEVPPRYPCDVTLQKISVEAFFLDHFDQSRPISTHSRPLDPPPVETGRERVLNVTPALELC